ncbi:MAG TPA: ABC transporter ATP-binding protein [Acidimicrobiia bacterium]|jgi:branched-chain amino acid transport system ATP-binding protein
MALLEIEDVVAGYGAGPDILTGVTLSIDEGTSYCIVGPNGAGKSTLLRTIAGILKPRAGEVRLDGTRMNGSRPDQMLAAGVCFVPQDASLFPTMTVRENLVMGGYLLGDRVLKRQRLEMVFETFPALADRKSQNAGTLSGGEQQMVTLGRSLMVEPKVVMIDEPSLGLAPMIADQIFEKIGGFRELGITVVLVEQNAVKGLESVDWGFVLDLGSKEFEGPADGILADPRIRELYLGKQLAPRERR